MRPTRSTRAIDAFNRIASHLLSADDHALLAEALADEGLIPAENAYMQHLQVSREALVEIGDKAHEAVRKGISVDPNWILEEIEHHTEETYWRAYGHNSEEGTV